MNGTAFDRQLTIEAAVPTDWQVEGTADFNGDGNDDLLLRRQSNGEQQIRFLRGSETLQVSSLTVAVPISFQVAGLADFDGEGRSC
jgi:hypothetical protein